MSVLNDLLQYTLPAIETVDEFEDRLQQCFESSFERLEIDEDQSQPVFGLNPEGTSSGIYSYTNWFYDGDESAFSPI